MLKPSARWSMKRREMRRTTTLDLPLPASA
jgi:hypothetical protein